MDKFKVTTQRMYVAYLYFKRINRDGTFTTADINTTERTKLLYWLKKLVGARWITKEGDRYTCTTYRNVWSSLQIKKVKKLRHSRFIFRYTTLKEYKELDFSGFKAHVLDQIRTHQAKRLVRQIKYRCDSVEVNSNITKKPILTTATTAKHLGFNSARSGSKYRKKYFNVKQDYKMIPFISTKGYSSWCYPPGVLVLSK